MILSRLLGIEKKDDPRLALYPQEVNDRSISYPRIPIRLIASMIDLLCIIVFILPILTFIHNFIPKSESQIAIEKLYVEYSKEYKNDFKKINQSIVSSPIYHENMNLSFYTKRIIELIIDLSAVIFYIWCNFKIFNNILGKRVLNLVVVDNKTYKPINFQRYIIRFIFSILTICTLMIGFIIGHFNLRRRAMHDFISNTVVVKLEKQVK